MERYRWCTSTNSSWSIVDPLPLLLIVTDAPWQIIDKIKNQQVDTETEVEDKTTNIQPGFVVAEGSVLVMFGNKKKFE